MIIYVYYQLFVTVTKIPGKNSLEEKKVILDHCVRGSGHGCCWLHHCGPEVKQSIMAECYGEESLNSWQPGNRDGGRARDKNNPRPHSQCWISTSHTPSACCYQPVVHLET